MKLFWLFLSFFPFLVIGIGPNRHRFEKSVKDDGMITEKVNGLLVRKQVLIHILTLYIEYLI